MSEQTSSPSAAGNTADIEYRDYLRRIQERFMANITSESGEQRPLFRTTLGEDSLWDLFIGTIPQDHRQYHTCSACKNFVRRYGDIVTIDDAGNTRSAVWDQEDAPDLYRAPVETMRKLIERAKIIGVFLSSDKVWGQPETGPWQHFSLTPPASLHYRGTMLTAGQRMAELRQDYITVVHALNDFPLPHAELACRILEQDHLYRSEKVLGPAKWFKELHEARKDKTGLKRDNVTWLAVATAPAGFAHVRSSMIGSLLEDIAAGLSFDDVAAKFKAKMHPLQYQRPTAAPSAGNIAEAEKIVEKLGIAASLKRRFCRLDEIEAIWKPAPEPEAKPETGGVFSHLKPKGDRAPDMKLPAITMTWAKFRDTVLPSADAIELKSPLRRGSFAALVTAADMDAPPIIQWDSQEQRNPVSWYFWNGGAPPSQFGLPPGSFVTVQAVTMAPHMWHGGSFANHGKFVMFILEGAQETRMHGAALFPEILKNELREIRSTIEAYSRSADIEGLKEPHVAGIAFGDDREAVHLRVTSKGIATEYKLDRWD